MKKLLFLIFLSAVFFVSCEKDFPGIVDYNLNQYQVRSVSPSGNILFNAQDSLINVRIEFSQNSKVRNVGFDIFSSTNEKLNSQRIALYDNGLSEYGDNVANDNIFSNRFPLSSSYPIGTYSTRFYISDQTAGEILIAQSSFVYDNGQSNVAPVISDVVVDPDTAVVNSATVIFCSVKVDDENGLNDIEIVYFIVYRPDGSSSNSQTQLFDNGDTQQNGDLVAGDGVFSRLIQVDESNQKGLYRFEFRARDRGGLLSNIINKDVLIQ